MVVVALGADAESLKRPRMWPELSSIEAVIPWFHPELRRVKHGTLWDFLHLFTSFQWVSNGLLRRLEVSKSHGA